MSLQKTADKLFITYYLAKEGYEEACKLGMKAKIPVNAREAQGKVSRPKTKAQRARAKAKKARAKKGKAKSATQLRNEEKRRTERQIAALHS
tara:strand:- start:336 stop:611 length:276 start_codon:yes stop_codon:yes gene_type:complete